ncbi:MAG: hypothetical protein ABR585_07815 [Gemmatimonadaceae bacterium]
MAWDPETGQTFGAYMRGDDGRTVEVTVGGRTFATKDQVVEGRTPEGGQFKVIRDQAGHDTSYETTPDGRERKHVHLNL